MAVKLLGLANVLARIAATERLFKAGTKRANLAAAEEVAQRISEIAPVDTGALSSSIMTQQEGDMAIVFTDIRYAPFQERGTNRHDPQEFFAPVVGAAVEGGMETGVVASVFKRILGSLLGR